MLLLTFAIAYLIDAVLFAPRVLTLRVEMRVGGTRVRDTFTLESASKCTSLRASTHAYHEADSNLFRATSFLLVASMVAALCFLEVWHKGKPSPVSLPPPQL